MSDARSRSHGVTGALRRAYFAEAAEAAGRYGVTFDRVLEHLWRARRRYHRIVLRSVTQMNDLVHAVACVDRADVAWRDLVARYERPMMRCCRVRLGETESLLLVRRLLHEMRDAGDDLRAGPSLAAYLGMQPLRDWLSHQAALAVRSTAPAPPECGLPAATRASALVVPGAFRVRLVPWGS